MDTRAIARILIHQVVVQYTAGKCWVFKRFIKECLFCLCLCNHALRGIGNTTSVVLCYYGGREDFLVWDGWFSNYIIPHTKPNHNVVGQSDIGFEEDRAHWYDACKHKLYAWIFVTGGVCRRRLSRILESDFILAFKHCAPNHKVMVVHSIKFIELRLVASELNVFIIGFYSSYVTFHALFPLSNPSIDVRRHVYEVTHTRHCGAEQISCRQCSFWEWGQLQTMTI